MTRRSRMHKKLLVGLLLLQSYGLPNDLLAQDRDFSLRGFGTLGLARSTDESAEFVRDLSQPHGLTESWRFDTDSSLGIQANLKFSPALEAVVQAVSRYRPNRSFEPEINWAFLGFAPAPAWQLRAGRLGTEFYMLADSRMVGYSYVTVRPPVDYYGTLPFSFIDGADVAVVMPFGGGLLKGKLYAGQSREQSPLGQQPDFDMSGSLLVGGYLDFIRGQWQFRAGHTRVRFEKDLPLEAFYQALPAASADELRVAGKWSSFTSLGLVYDAGPLQTQFMLSKTLNDHGTFQDTWAGYLITSYRLNDFTPFVGLSAAKSTPKDLHYPIHPYTDQYQADFHSDQRTLFFGTRWDFRPKMCFKAQVDIVRGDADSRFLYRWETPDWDGSMAVFSLALDFVF